MERGQDEEWCPHLHLPVGGESSACLQGLHLVLGVAAEFGLVLAPQTHPDCVPASHLGLGLRYLKLAHG